MPLTKVCFPSRWASSDTLGAVGIEWAKWVWASWKKLDAVSLWLRAESAGLLIPYQGWGFQRPLPIPPLASVAKCYSSLLMSHLKCSLFQDPSLTTQGMGEPPCSVSRRRPVPLLSSHSLAATSQLTRCTATEGDGICRELALCQARFAVCSVCSMNR